MTVYITDVSHSIVVPLDEMRSALDVVAHANATLTAKWETQRAIPCFIDGSQAIDVVIIYAAPTRTAKLNSLETNAA
jgi:hypothetical protein